MRRVEAAFQTLILVPAVTSLAPALVWLVLMTHAGNGWLAAMMISLAATGKGAMIAPTETTSPERERDLH
jgi:hypothetical protein